jgi:hypothetical protein
LNSGIRVIICKRAGFRLFSLRIGKQYEKGIFVGRAGYGQIKWNIRKSVKIEGISLIERYISRFGGLSANLGIYQPISKFYPSIKFFISRNDDRSFVREISFCSVCDDWGNDPDSLIRLSDSSSPLRGMTESSDQVEVVACET